MVVSTQKMMLKSVMPVLPCKAMQQSMQYSEAQRIIAPWYFFVERTGSPFWKKQRVHIIKSSILITKVIISRPHLISQTGKPGCLNLIHYTWTMLTFQYHAMPMLKEIYQQINQLSQSAIKMLTLIILQGKILLIMVLTSNKLSVLIYP